MQTENKLLIAFVLLFLFSIGFVVFEGTAIKIGGFLNQEAFGQAPCFCGVCGSSGTTTTTTTTTIGPSTTTTIGPSTTTTIGPSTTTTASIISNLNLPNKPISDIIADLVDWLLTLVTVIAILMLVIGGVMYLVATGDEMRLQSAKRIIVYALIGLFICGISYIIVKTIADIITK